MRLRNVRGSKEELEKSVFVVQNLNEWKERFCELFNNSNPLHIEVGMGKGKFITTLAAMNPNINYIGIDKFSNVLIRAAEKQNESKLPNLFLMRADAEQLTEIFGKHEVERIYLNFSDPWPKDRHAKRRLTSKKYLSIYHQILKENGTVQFKTDNQELFNFSIMEANDSGWDILYQTYDLHHSESKMLKNNVQTEYEEKFSKKGNPICAMIIGGKTSLNCG